VEEDLDPALWGRRPSESEAALAAVTNLRKQFDRRRELENASLSRAEAADLLGTSEQAVTDYLESGRLLGLRRGRRWLIPAWQFHADTERGVLPGLSQLGRVFPGGVVAMSLWVTRPSADLGDRTPRDVLARGDVEPVVRVARSLTSAGW
jgi:excisionase family DNA binding protein